MPKWFQDRFHFAKDEFRPTGETWEKYIFSKVKRSISQIVLFSRLVRSKSIDVAQFTDPDVGGYYFQCEGKRCLAMWSSSPTLKYFRLPDVAQITFENKFLQRKPLDVQQGKTALFLGDAPITLIGVEKDLTEDNSVAIVLPHRTDPGQSVQATISFANSAAADRTYDFALAVADGWEIAPAKIQKTVAAGKSADVTVKLTPPKDVSEGTFQLNVSGTAVLCRWPCPRSLPSPPLARSSGGRTTSPSTATCPAGAASPAPWPTRPSRSSSAGTIGKARSSSPRRSTCDGTPTASCSSPPT